MLLMIVTSLPALFKLVALSSAAAQMKMATIKCTEIRTTGKYGDIKKRL